MHLHEVFIERIEEFERTGQDELVRGVIQLADASARDASTRKETLDALRKEGVHFSPFDEKYSGRIVHFFDTPISVFAKLRDKDVPGVKTVELPGPLFPARDTWGSGFFKP